MAKKETSESAKSVVARNGNHEEKFTDNVKPTGVSRIAARPSTVSKTVVKRSDSKDSQRSSQMGDAKNAKESLAEKKREEARAKKEQFERKKKERQEELEKKKQEDMEKKKADDAERKRKMEDKKKADDAAKGIKSVAPAKKGGKDAEDDDDPIAKSLKERMDAGTINSVVPAKGGAAKKEVKKVIGAPKIPMSRVESSTDGKLGGLAGATPKANKAMAEKVG